jgi:hypothetical protein
MVFRGPDGDGVDVELRTEPGLRLDPAGVDQGELARQCRILDQELAIVASLNPGG